MGYVVRVRGNTFGRPVGVEPEELPNFVGGGWGDSVPDGDHAAVRSPYPVIDDTLTDWLRWRKAGRAVLGACLIGLLFWAAVYELVKW